MNRKDDARKVTEEGEAETAFLGNVVSVEAVGPHGDFRLVYEWGKVVYVDCGWVGATVYVEKEGQ